MKKSALCQSRIIGLLLFVLLIVPAGATEFTLTGGESCVPAESTTNIQVALSDLPQGLSGLNVSYAISDPSVAVISSISPATWAMLPVHTALPSGQTQLKTIDLNQAVNPGAQNVIISDLALHSLKQGTVLLTVTSIRVEDDSGGRYSISPVSRTICFGNSSESLQETTTTSPTAITTTVQTLTTTSQTQTVTSLSTIQTPSVSVTKTATDTLVPGATKASDISQPASPTTVPQNLRTDRMTTKAAEPTATVQSPLTSGLVIVSLMMMYLAVLSIRKIRE